MRLLTFIVMAVMLGAMALSFYHITHSMSLTGSTTDCPFMAHEAAICPMDLVDHLVAWKSSFVTAVETLSFLLLILGLGVVWHVVRIFIPLAMRWRVLARGWPLPVFDYSFSIRPLQELYAAGILNSKTF